MTKKQAYKIANNLINRKLNDDKPVGPLCDLLGSSPLYNDWIVYWRKVNTNKVYIIPEYFEILFLGHTETICILRMLTLCMFIEDTYR